MDLINKIKAAKTIVECNISKKRVPLAVVHLITRRCDSRCKYCDIYERPKPEMSTEEVFRLLGELKESGTQKYSMFGGEPLLRKDIGEIIDHSKSLGFFTSFGSNGYLLPRKIDEVENVDMINFSFDGPEEVHDLHRIKGAHEKVVKAIEIARERGIQVITQTVITKHNLEQIDYILEKAKELGFRAGFQPVMHRPTGGDKISSLRPEKEAYKETIRKLIKEKKRTGLVANSVGGLDHLMYTYDWPEYKKTVKCWAGNLHVYIDCDGALFACLHTEDKTDENPNCVQLGFKKAYEKLKTFDCYGCWSWSTVELNKLFSLEPDAVMNTIRIT